MGYKSNQIKSNQIKSNQIKSINQSINQSINKIEIEISTLSIIIGILTQCRVIKAVICYLTCQIIMANSSSLGLQFKNKGIVSLSIGNILNGGNL